MDIIDVSPDDLWLRGDVLSGVVLRGWNGLAEQRTHTAAAWRSVFLRGPVVNGDVQWVLVAPDEPAFGRSSAKFVRVFCTLPGFRDHLRRVLAAGKRCVACDGEGKSGPKMSAFKWTDDGMVRCSACNGTGYTRQPHDLSPFIGAEIAGRITPLVAAGLMWASVQRVEAGLGPVRAWGDAVFPAPIGTPEHTRMVWRGMLRDGHIYALLDEGHVLLPLPDRIARLRLEG